MHGFLRRFFAPRWRHPDAKVRRQAIRQLDPAHPEQQQALEALCLDGEAAVRQAALARLDSPARLMDLLNQRPQLKEIGQRLVELLAQPHGTVDLAQRLSRIEQLGDPELLAQIALEADDPSLRLAAVARLVTEEDLITQACENGIAAVRHAAAARVTSETGLQYLAQQARRDSQVMRQARERLALLRDAATAVAAAQARRETLLRKLETQAGAPWEPLYAGRFRHLTREWQALDTPADAEQEQRFQQAAQRCRQLIVEREAQARVIAQEQQQPEELTAERPTREAVRADKTETAHQEQNSPPQPQEPLSQQEKIALPQTPAATAETEQASVPDPARLARFNADLKQLEKLLDSGASRDANRLHQSLRQRADAFPKGSLGSHRVTLKQLGARLAELHDWRGFVATPKRNQLCQAITALADDTNTADAELDRRHRQLIRDWKALGDAAANRELSHAFRSASDRIHQRLTAWQEQQAAVRARHLEARIALCDQLEALLTTPAEDADPDALRRIRDQARHEWQQCSPVPHDQAKAVGRRFRQILGALQQLIDQRATQIADAKRALVTAAGELLSRPLAAEARAQQAKELQRHWQALGRAPRGEEQALWREFRARCDQIFALREAQRDNQAQQTRERLDTLQALINRLDAWQPTRLTDQAELDNAIKQVDALRPLPPGRRTDGMRRRWDGIVRARRERLAQLGMREEIERWLTYRPLLDAHLAADAACREHGAGERVALDPALDLSAEMRDAHEQRNAARQDPPPAEEIGERLTYLRAHLSLLALGRLRQQDEPLRLAIQVERLNAGVGRELSRIEEIRSVLHKLLATGPVSAEQWAGEKEAFEALYTQLTRLPT